MKIRSITLFADLNHTPLAQAATFVRAAQHAYQAAEFGVQTTRLALDVFSDPNWLQDPTSRAVELEQACLDEGFEYVALGPAPVEVLPKLPALLAATQRVFVTTHIIDPETGVIDGTVIRGAAQVIQQAMHIEDGFGNLRFAALAHVPPGTPFFPAAYNAVGATQPSFALALQSADLAVDAAQGATDAQEAGRRLTEAIETQANRLLHVAQALSAEHGVRFGGFDFSLAPFPTLEDSIGAALEALTGQPLGSAGTLAAAAVLTNSIERARFPHTGFCGLMLPVLEDTVLAQRAAEGFLNVGELLQWSAVCGTGLDTVPLAGNVPLDTLAGLLFDVAALSARLHKPLTARLMPLPGKIAGDPVHFDFAYFADGGVLPLRGGPGPVVDTIALGLKSRANKGLS